MVIIYILITDEKHDITFRSFKFGSSREQSKIELFRHTTIELYDRNVS